MDSYLLATKLRVPPQPHRAVQRPRLVDTLERELPHYKLVWLSAPAGYGKTTLLSQWAQRSRFPIVWLSASEEDNDLIHFFRYLLAGWEEIQPGIKESALGLILGGAEPESDAILTAFINVANDCPNHIVFVVDDFHLIQEPSIHQSLTFLLDHLPPTIHFVLAGRAEPPLPLARYRARRELLEFGVDDLHFAVAETEDFLNDSMGLGLIHDEIVSLQTQLEGWIAGLQLVSLTLQRRRERVGKLLISGRHRFIADYLNQDVIAELPEKTRRFLLQTSILDQLCSALCDAVTGGEEGQEMLERLEQANLFLVPLDDSRRWFRYHRLFADFLHEELNRHYPAEVASLHRQAARWYLAHDLPEQALHHAVAGGDAALVKQIAEQYFEAKLLSGEFNTLRRWLELIPKPIFADYPLIGLIRAGIHLFTGEIDAGIRCIDEVEHELASATGEDNSWSLARVTAIRCTVACFYNDVAQAESYAHRALKALPEEDHSSHAIIYHALGDSYRRNGRWQEAREYYFKVLELIHAPAFQIRSVHVFGALADLALRQGRLRESAAYWQQALAVIQEPASWGTFPLPLTGWVYIRMGEILYEWNELAEASKHLSQGLERAELGGDVRAMIAGYVITGRLKLTVGDIAAAVEYLERARPLVENSPFAEWSSHFGRLQLECWLAQRKLRAAVDWADELLRGGVHEGQPESEVAQMAVARVLIAKGDAPSLTRALALLERLCHAAETEGRVSIHSEALALQALAYWRRGEQARAMTSLEHALRMAKPEGYVRLFADLGLPLARLLQEARSRAVMPDYIEKLLAAIGDERSFSIPAAAALPEPLSAREQEVLQLLAAGLTNREIAEQLVISAETVKKHVGNLCDKLGVSNRTQAVTRARELDLLA
jgi:LuxR family transcriptional regulator, maltose regulon positive regulatory protein